MTYYQRINLGNYRDFVIKNIDEPETYGTFQFGDKYDKKSMDEFIEKVNHIIKENEELKERNNRQKETITKQQEQIDNYIDIKAKLNAKIKEYETKSEEYELGACICGARKYAFKMQALAEFKEGIYENKNNNEFQS